MRALAEVAYFNVYSIEPAHESTETYTVVEAIDVEDAGT
jgi:hypothetical protein